MELYTIIGTARKYAVLTFLGLVFLFLAMVMMDTVFDTQLRILNVLILITTNYFGLREIKIHHPEEFTYWQGHSWGWRMNFWAIGGFAVFLFVYMVWLDPNFINELHAAVPLTEELSAAAIAAIIFMEGMISSVVVGYSLMLLLKKTYAQETLHQD